MTIFEFSLVLIKIAGKLFDSYVNINARAAEEDRASWFRKQVLY